MNVTTEWDLWLMSAVIFVPTLFALGLLFFPRGFDEGMRWWSLGGTLVTLVLTIFLFIDFQQMLGTYPARGTGPDSSLASRVDEAILKSQAKPAGPDSLGGPQPPESRDLVARVPWIKEPFKIDYYLGVDGISMALILLTSALSFLGMLASWNIGRSVKGYCMLFLLLETGMLGTFLALDLFLFFVFWEIMLLPMYFLIGIWGGPRREYAAIKFFLYTMFGSILILIAILAFYFTDVTPLQKQLSVRAQNTGEPAEKAEVQREADAVKAAIGDGRGPANSFDIMLFHKVGQESARLEYRTRDLHEKLESGDADTKANAAASLAKMRQDYGAREVKPLFARNFQIIMFILLFIGFAIKVPIFPFHTWLPDAHVEAPTPISMILAGVLLKMGGYGILRIAYPICPWAAYEFAWWLGLLGVINIVYGAFAAMAQTDFKKLVAYSSISHMGYVILGIAVWSSYGDWKYWAWGMNGAMYQMIAHGITSAGMFFLVGVIYDRAHHRDLNNFGGLNNSMPLYSGMSAIIFFGAMGLPGLCGFIGEFFTVLGTWNYSVLFAVLAAVTVVFTAGYILWTLQRVYLGENPKYQGLLEITPREILIGAPLVVLTVLLGVWPNLVLDWMAPSVNNLVQTLARITSPS